MNLPDTFASQTRQLMGGSLYGTFAKSLDSEPPVSIRLNPWKCCGVIASAIDGGPVPWCPEGRYLSDRPNFTFDPLLHAGLYYVQEASSMFVSHILRQYVGHSVVMLDMCAAPGGKSISALTALPQGSLLFSNEPVHTRANILAENLMKLGHPDVVVTQNYPASYKSSGLRFDVILTDAPCSGEGMFRKDPASIGEWSQRNVESCQKLQRQILADAWECLNPGGLLIYSTCTLNRSEDEDNAAWAEQELGATLLPVDTDPAWGITGALTCDWHGPVYRFVPGVARGEGMFFAVMRKPGTLPRSPFSDSQKTASRHQRGTSNELRQIMDASQYTVHEINGTVHAVPKRWQSILQQSRSLKVIMAGIPLGTVKGKDFVPTQGLALSTQLDKRAYVTVDVDRKTAISYLQKSTSLDLPAGTPRGIVLITHKGHSLGFVKHLGNRTNNLYPNEWKIRNQSATTESQDIIDTRQ